jgi:hypothetical protein
VREEEEGIGEDRGRGSEIKTHIINGKLKPMHSPK